MTQTIVQHGIDPITLEVVRHGLVAAADQIDANITRTAFSPYIYEYKDFAVGITDETGQLLAQNTGGMPPFVADAVSMAVRDGLAVYRAERLHPGDVVLCNHAAVQGQHLNNTVMYTPIFAGQPSEPRLIGFFAINVHWIDIGGSVPHATDIFAEGLQLRSVKLWSRGEPIEEVYRIIECSSRFPTELMGDIAAQLAGCLLGRDLIGAMAERYGLEVWRRTIAALLDQSEAAARARIRAIPDGRYTSRAVLDSDGAGGPPLPIEIAVRVADETLTIDYSGLPAQVRGCINAGQWGGGRTTARVAFKYLVVPGEPANEGLFRPLELILPPGTLLSADPTAPMGNYSRAFPTVIDAVIRAFERALPERVAGGHFGNFAVIRFLGRDADGRPFDCIDAGHGGWGASLGHDGSGPYRTMAHGDTRIIPTELLEAMYPFRVEQFSLRQDSGGPGRFRGGLGYSKTYCMTGPATMRVDFDRTLCPPWGVLGGGDGATGFAMVQRRDAPVPEQIFKSRGLALGPGDVVHAQIGGGGGYGQPRERERRRVIDDLRQGYISAAAAARDYGVSLEQVGE